MTSTSGKQGNPLTGVVLAGGLSSRLGHDKARIHLVRGEEPDLLARALTLLARCCDRVIVVGREHPSHECYPDATPGQGPAGGIATALEVTRAPILVLSCDLPFMELPVLQRLIECRNRKSEQIMSTCYRQRETGHIEALVAVYEPEALPYFQDCVDSGKLKISRILPEHMQHYLDYSAEDSLPFFNINYPADLEVARRVMRILGQR